MVALLFVPSPHFASGFPRQSGLENLGKCKTQELQSTKTLILLNFLMLEMKIINLQKHHPISGQNLAKQKM